MQQNKKKILFLNFDGSKHPYFETSLELMENEIAKGNEIYSLSCNSLLDKYCCNHVRGQKFNRENDFCKKCKRGYKAGMKMLKIPAKNQFILKPVKVPHFKTFKTIDEIKNFSIEDVNIGFGIASTVMTYTRDYQYNPSEEKILINKLLTNSYTILKNLENIYDKIKFDEIYVFNGRYYEFNTGIAFAKKYEIDFYIYESGSDYTRYLLRKNVYIHDFQTNQQEIIDLWNNEKDNNLRTEIAVEWVVNRRNAIAKNWRVFTKKQTCGKLPENFDKTKENIAIYNTSLDEVGIFDEYKNPIDENDNNILREIIKRYENDETKHFYLRIHPNLKNLKTTQIKEIKKMIKSKPKCMSFIKAKDDIDTYALMENCDKILVFCSTMGIESTYWGKPSILAGVALYDRLDCIYKAKNYNELWNLIDSKNLKPKPKENTYPYFYWMNHRGIMHEIYKPEKLFVGTYRGKNFRELELNPIVRFYNKLKEILR